MSHDWPGGEDNCATGDVACASEIRLFEIVEPVNDFLGLGISEHDANLAFYLLERVWGLTIGERP